MSLQRENLPPHSMGPSMVWMSLMVTARIQLSCCFAWPMPSALAWIT